MPQEKIFDALCDLGRRIGGVEEQIKDVSSKLDAHVIEEKPVLAKVEEMHIALFHPDTGLVNVKKWMCRIATWWGVILGGVLTALATIASIGHRFGWW